MAIEATTCRRVMKNQLRDPLYVNLLYAFSPAALAVGSGFLFWMIAAQLYREGDIWPVAAMLPAGARVSTGLLIRLKARKER